MFESVIQWRTNLCYSDNTYLLACTSYELMELFIFLCSNPRIISSCHGGLSSEGGLLEKGCVLTAYNYLSSAFLRHGFLHSVKAYRRSRLLSCGKSEKILLLVVTNLNTPGLFCFCLFVCFFFFRGKGGAIGWNDQRLFCCARFFFFSLQSKPSVSNLLNARIRWLLTLREMWAGKKRSSEAWGRE